MEDKKQTGESCVNLVRPNPPKPFAGGKDAWSWAWVRVLALSDGAFVRCDGCY
jgi:hypothetical protein